jgi:DNA-binding NarL/FixJ family response regulator
VRENALLNTTKATIATVPSRNEVRILVADDFDDWRALVRDLLRSTPQWQVIGEARDGLEAVEKAAESLPDVVVLDIGMPRLNGIEAARIILRTQPGTRIVFLSQNNDEDVRSAALATGAHGYVLKANCTTELQPVIEAGVCNGPQHQRPLAPALSIPSSG